ncbi:MAG: hypothetical protein F6J98_14970 [Moorea sp. SIO4G2]|nr:hypothetical protein [Moorena sp. SIO4G2]
MMKYLKIAVLFLFITSTDLVLAQENHIANKSEPQNTVGLMSEEVVRARIRAMGYKQPTKLKLQDNQIQNNSSGTTTVKYQATTVRDGKRVTLEINPLSGLIEERQESTPNRQTTPWGTPYQLDENVCRDRGTDTVCLTPTGATNLRWDIPSK